MGNPRPSTKERLARLRAVAKAVAMMEAGTYEWPDGKPHYDGDGCFKVNKSEAMRYAGYEDPDAYNSRYEKVFNNERYLEFLALERLRQKKTALQHISDTKGDIQSLRKASAAELQVRFEHDPGQFTVNELIKLFAITEELERRELGNFAPEIEGKTININTLTIGLAGKLPEGEFESFIEQAEEQKLGELKRIEQMRYAMRAKRKEEDTIEAEEADVQELS